MTERLKVLMVFVNESQRWEDTALYKAIVQRLRQLNASGATVVRGLMSFGHHHRVHGKGLLGIPDDRPLTITVVDTEARIRELVPELRAMAPEELMLILDAEEIPPDASPR